MKIKKTFGGFIKNTLYEAVTVAVIEKFTVKQALKIFQKSRNTVAFISNSCSIIKKCLYRIES